MSSPHESREQVQQLIRSAAVRSHRDCLTYDDFRRITGLPMSRVLKYFDSWTEACLSVDVKPGEVSPRNITGNRSKGKDHARAELVRIAEKLGAKTLTKREFDSQKPDVKAQTVANLWGGWDKALDAAGLVRHPLFPDKIPLSALADEFLGVCEELGKIPTLQQLSRRSKHGKHSFTRKFDGHYPLFMIAAIQFLLSNADLSEETHIMLKTHLERLKSESESPLDRALPHAKGRHLGFRAFAFAPTYEAEVVSLFSSIADELGFEIVAQRPAFPDCEARASMTPDGNGIVSA